MGANSHLQSITDGLIELRGEVGGVSGNTNPESARIAAIQTVDSLLQALDDVHLAPGFAYSEREVGTNGLGLALADRVPTLVRADEHYSLSLCTFTCAAVPVLDPSSGRPSNVNTVARAAEANNTMTANEVAVNIRFFIFLPLS